MGYLFLSISLFSGALKGFCGKKLGNFADDLKSSVLLNLKRMLLCVLFGAVVLLLLGDIGYILPSGSVLLIAALSGVGTTAFVVSWLLAVRKNAYMMLDVFLMLGTLVPMLLGRFILSEPITLKQWIGFAVLIVATLIMCSYNSSIKGKITVSSIILLLISGLANGVTDFSQKLYVKTLPELPVSVFNFYTYVFAAITLALILLFLPKGDKQADIDDSSKIKSLYVLIMAVALSANSFFKTMAAGYLDSARLYPLNQGASMLLSILMASIFFKEKFTLKAFFGIVLAFAALMIMNT